MPPHWPPLPNGWGNVEKEYRKQIVVAEIDLAKAAAQEKPSPPKSQADEDSEKKLHETLGTLSSGSIERAREGAKFVETSAAALGTIYTGILAFAFAAADRPLPGRGLYAAIFLGVAIVGASFYLAFIQRIPPIGRVAYRGSRAEDLWRRTEYLGAWTGAVVRSRAWALRTAVFALALGVMFMPVAFLPDKLPSNPLAVLSVAEVSAPSPAPSPTWPPPPSGISEPAVAAVLYEAQLNEFTKATTSSPPATSPSGAPTDGIAVRLFLIGLAVLVVVAAWDPLSSLARRIRRSN
jgi:hypothetical protein